MSDILPGLSNIYSQFPGPYGGEPGGGEGGVRRKGEDQDGLPVIRGNLELYHQLAEVPEGQILYYLKVHTH